MKKALLVFLSLTLVFSAFACTDTPEIPYTEVAQDEYASTLSQFLTEDNIFDEGLAPNVHFFHKLSISDADTTTITTQNVRYIGSGSNLKISMEATVKETSTPDYTLGVYVSNGYIYSNSNGDKSKEAYSEQNLAALDVPATADILLNFLLTNFFYIDLDNPDFIASITKMEVSGSEGNRRMLRITSQEASLYCVLDLTFDKDNKLTYLHYVHTSSDGWDYEEEYILETCTGITFPSFADYVEQVA